MAVTPLITISEADQFNGLSSGWMGASSEYKTRYILNASTYMQAKWDCADVDWSDTSTLDDDLKRACAYYADADRLGVLFPAVEETEPHRAIIKERKKLEGMEKETMWADIGALTSKKPLESINAIMRLHCTRVGRVLTRV